MGCAGSKNTKVVKFQEPTSPTKKLPTSTTPVPSTSISAENDAQSKIPDNSINNNNNEQHSTPVIELPKVEPTTKLQQNTKETTPVIPPPVSHVANGTNKDNKTLVVEDVKNGISLEGGVLETRGTVIDAATSKIFSPTKMNSPSNKLTILHFNDVYNIEPRDKEPVGGAARFVTKMKSFQGEPLILFSGDLLNPSLSKIYIV